MGIIDIMYIAGSISIFWWTCEVYYLYYVGGADEII